MGRVAKNILRLRELATIISKQLVIVPEQELRALLPYNLALGAYLVMVYCKRVLIRNMALISFPETAKFVK